MTRPVENIGVGSAYATFLIDKTGEDFDLAAENEGAAVALSGNDEIDLGSEDDAILGQLLSVQDDIGVVQIAGVIRVPYDSESAPSVGGQVAVDGAGKVKASEAGRGLVLAVNAEAETADILL